MPFEWILKYFAFVWKTSGLSENAAECVRKASRIASFPLSTTVYLVFNTHIQQTQHEHNTNATFSDGNEASRSPPALSRRVFVV